MISSGGMSDVTMVKYGLAALALGLILLTLIPVVVTEVEKYQAQANKQWLRIPANVTGHSGDRDRFAHGHRAGVSFVL